MKQYECIKGLYVEKCDGDGFTTDKFYTVKEGSRWFDREENYRIAGGEIHLEAENGRWLELPKETIVENFREIV